MSSSYHSLFIDLNDSRAHWANEEEVRISWLKHLENSLGVTFHAERGRNDASYNQVIIEFKRKGLFRGNMKSKAFKEAINDRLYKYIARRSKAEGVPAEEYIGIAIDGDHIAFAFFKGGSIHHRNLLPFNEASVSLVAQACKDSKRRAITAENLVEDFGHSSKVGKTLMSALAHELEERLRDTTNNKTKMLFEEWCSLFGQVADLSSTQAKDIHRQVSLKIDIDFAPGAADILFVIHTYNAFVMKMLAAEIVSEYGLTAHSNFCEYLLGYDDDSLLDRLNRDIEQSAFFAEARIKGFVEEAIFSWYAGKHLTASGKAKIVHGVRELLIQLALYRMDDLSAARSRDVLKAFYQSLVPETLRKTLGEFYTPDWLVDVTCDRTGVEDWLKPRVLDPTCGSGSFLLEAVRRKRLAAKFSGMSAKETLRHVLASVWGFDLNPLAVQAARVNFLIAIADLVAATKTEVELPVLLADAVYSPAIPPGEGDEYVEYQIGSDQSDLTVTVPRDLAFDRMRLDQIFEAMGTAVDNEVEYDKVEHLLIAQGAMTKMEAASWKSALEKTYNQVLELHKNAWNGIWFRIVRNFFWSVVAGEFDIVVGNPPWVRWSNLPERYRERIKPTCEQYAIFSETPYHGGNELDISGMLTYTVGDKWLKLGGTLVFVITQTHFQSPSSQGFRSFKINDETNLVPMEVDDLKKLKPFPRVSNKTAILRLQKVDKDVSPSYPITYRVWDKANGAQASLPEASTKSDIFSRVYLKDWEANPVDGGNSPWAVLPPGRFKDMAAIQGESDWLAGRKGITADVNGIYMVRVVDTNPSENLVRVETRPEAGRTDIGAARRFWVEPDLLYPLLKGAGDFSACHLHLKDELFVLVPNLGIVNSAYDDAEATMSYLRQTSKFFHTYKDLLAKRSTYRLRQKNAPYYAIYNVGSYTFAPYKVVWAELSTSFEAAVISDRDFPLGGRKVFVPDHKIYFAEFHDKDVAYFICGLLNSQLVKEYVTSHTIQIQVSNIFKHLSLPKFSASDCDHKALSKLCASAHAESGTVQKTGLLDQISDLAEKILL